MSNIVFLFVILFVVIVIEQLANRSFGRIGKRINQNGSSIDEKQTMVKTAIIQTKDLIF